jgi:membrane protein implicated in regulation of membrane protease activity
MRIIRISYPQPGFKARLIIGLALLLMGGIVALFALLAIGMTLFMMPAILLAAAVYALLPKRRSTNAPRRGDDVLEGKFRVVDRAPDPPPSGHLPHN